jgi:hypothetical protein
MTHAEDVRTVDETPPSTTEKSLETAVTVHECSPRRTVFTEDGNSDGWIATDTTVELDR